MSFLQFFIFGGVHTSAHVLYVLGHLVFCHSIPVQHHKLKLKINFFICFLLKLLMVAHLDFFIAHLDVVKAGILAFWQVEDKGLVENLSLIHI